MTQQELLNRAGVWLNQSDTQKREIASRNELNSLYQAVTGKVADCTSCTNWLLRMEAKLREYVANPDLFTIQPTQKEIMANTSSKYRISKAAKENGTETVVLNHANSSEVIHLSSMTDAQAERILASPRFKHNVEVIKTKESADETPAKSSKKASAKTAATSPAPQATQNTQKEEAAPADTNGE